ncbi:MAG: glycosyltransferase [Deltaproteobacteria bacterium]|nr:glycosyltransferase [Deltaproteobacteria bacterium]
MVALIRALPPRFEKSVAFLCTGGPVAQELAGAGIPVHVLGMRRAYDPRGALELYRLVRRLRCDVVHDHSSMAVAPILALGLGGIPLVVTEHLALAPRRLDQRLSYRLLSRFVDCFIANSRVTRDELLAHGVATDKVRVIYHGLEPGASPSHAEARRALGAGDVIADPLVGFVGRLEPEKGCRQFVAVAAQVAAAVPQARFVVAGDGSERAAVVADIAAAGLRERIDLLGNVSDIERIYPAFDVMVSTSERETFGLAMLEAMAAGVAVAAFSVGGAGELIEAGAGVAVAPGDVTAMAAAVIDLLRDGGRRQAIGVQARARVAARFSAAHMAAEVAEVYDSVCGRKASPHRDQGERR